MDLVDHQKRYFEAILQLRNPTDEVLRYIKNQLIKRKNVDLTMIEQTDEGYDLYLSDQRWTRSLGNNLRKAFGGEVLGSKKLFGRNRQTSKTIYRVTVCYRYPQKEEPPKGTDS